MANAVLHRIDASIALVPQDVARNVANDALRGEMGHYTSRSAAPRHGNLTFSLITDIIGFEALETEWSTLLDRSVQPWQVFQTFAWNWHWSRHYVARPGRRGVQLAIVTGRHDGRLALILPVAVSRSAGLKHLSWMGEPVSQYGDVIAAPGADDIDTLQAAFDFLVRETRADVANLRKVRADAVVAPLLAKLQSSITATEEAPFMTLSTAPDHETYENRSPSKRRKNRRRQMRRLEERGSVTFEKHSGTEDAGLLADYAVRLKRVSLGSKGQIAPTLADSRFAAFFADAARGLGRPVGCYVMAIRSNNEIGAMQIVLDRGQHRFLHVAVFAGKFEKCGTGALLLEHAIGDCFNNGIGTFDMLAPKHEYKMDFADGTVLVQDHAIGLTRTGRAYVSGVLGMRANVKQAIERLPAPARRLVGDAIALVRRRA